MHFFWANLAIGTIIFLFKKNNNGISKQEGKNVEEEMKK